MALPGKICVLGLGILCIESVTIVGGSLDSVHLHVRSLLRAVLRKPNQNKCFVLAGVNPDSWYFTDIYVSRNVVIPTKRALVLKLFFTCNRSPQKLIAITFAA